MLISVYVMTDHAIRGSSFAQTNEMLSVSLVSLLVLFRQVRFGCVYWPCLGPPLKFLFWREVPKGRVLYSLYQVLSFLFAGVFGLVYCKDV